MLLPDYLSRNLTPPIPTKDGGTLRTIGEACEYMAAIGKEREQRRHWQQVRELMLQEADVAAVSRRVRLAVTSTLASFKTASRTRRLTAATSASWSISSRTCCQWRRCSRSLPIAAMYSHASPIVRSVPPSLVGIGGVKFLE